MDFIWLHSWNIISAVFFHAQHLFCLFFWMIHLKCKYDQLLIVAVQLRAGRGPIIF